MSESSEKVSRAEMIALLRCIADSMESGKSSIVQVGRQEIAVPGDAAVEVEYERDGDSEELEIELSWSRKGADGRNLRAKAGIGLAIAGAAIGAGAALIDYARGRRRATEQPANSSLPPIQQTDPQEG